MTKLQQTVWGEVWSELGRKVPVPDYEHTQ